MLAIGEGASEEAQDQIRQLGSQNVILRAVKPPDDVVSNASSRVVSYGLKNSDLARIKETFPGVRRVAPVREIYEEVRYSNRALNPRVLATVPLYREVTGRVLSEGRFLSDQDMANVANVCVLSYEVARYLFPFESPIVQVDEVVVDPHFDSATTIAGPGAGLLSNDAMWIDAVRGIVTLTSYTLDCRPSAAKITYRAGYDSASPEVATIRLALLELIGARWNRYKNKSAGLQSKKQGDNTATFMGEAVDSSVIRQLEPFRRQHA